jgi:hypothetical protein
LVTPTRGSVKNTTSVAREKHTTFSRKKSKWTGPSFSFCIQCVHVGFTCSLLVWGWWIPFQWLQFCC